MVIYHAPMLHIKGYVDIRKVLRETENPIDKDL